MPFVLDACALIAFLNDEEGGEKIENILNQSVIGESIVCMSIMNLLEVFYSELREKGLEIAEVVLSVIDAYGVTIIDTVSASVFHSAAHIKADYRCSLADAVGLATTFDLSGTFVTSDGEILPIDQQEPINIFWFRPPKEKTK
jgi:PIN domain nuclease of toxin-antitoxin system